jgi:hypothetical protein
MAKKPDLSGLDKPLTEEELQDLKRGLALLSPLRVQDMYREAHRKCAMPDDQLPDAAAVQELVAIWRALRKWKRLARYLDRPRRT